MLLRTHKAFLGQFSGAEHFSNGYARVMVDTSWGVINSAGKFVIKPNHDMVEYMNEGFIAIEKNEKWAFFDLKRKKYITKFKKNRMLINKKREETIFFLSLLTIG